MGFQEFRVFLLGALAPNLGGFMAYFGTQIGNLLNGSLIVETVFQWNGMGSLIATAVLSRDYPLIEASLACVTLITLITQQIGYQLQAWWDPKVRYAQE